MEYEAGQRHADILKKGMGVDEGCEGVVMPGVSPTEGGQIGAVLVGGENLFRAVAARGNYYLGQDRVDMQIAAKEISTLTSKPKEQDWKSAKRLTRYMEDTKGMVREHNFQGMPEKRRSGPTRILQGTSEQEGQLQEAR